METQLTNPNTETHMEALGMQGREDAGLFGYMGDSSLVTLTTTWGFELQCKPDHRVYATDSKKEWGWRHAVDLTAANVSIRAGDRLWNSASPVLGADVMTRYAYDIIEGKNPDGVPLAVRTACADDVQVFLAAFISELPVTCVDELTARELQCMYLNQGVAAVRTGRAITGFQELASNLIDDKVVSVVPSGEGPTYDINMPETSTIVTNGIVSHNSDVRLRQTSRALSVAPFSPQKGKKTYDEQEPSVEFGGLDTYRYVHVKAHKNKLWTPQRECLIRIWVEDGAGVARGLDPVFDTIYYLKQTGQISGTRKGFKFNLHKLGAASKPIPWHVLKRWVLGSRDDMAKIAKTAGYPKPFDLRQLCFKQIATGVGEELYIAAQKETPSDKDDDDGDDGQ